MYGDVAGSSCNVDATKLLFSHYLHHHVGCEALLETLSSKGQMLRLSGALSNTDVEIETGTTQPQLAVKSLLNFFLTEALEQREIGRVGCFSSRFLSPLAAFILPLYSVRVLALS